MDKTTNDTDERRITPLDGITAFQRDLMTIIAHQEGVSGTEITAKLDPHYNDPIQHSRLYIALDDLVTDGLVEKGKRDGRTNEYRLTRAGEDGLLSHIEWQMGAHLDGGSDE